MINCNTINNCEYYEETNNNNKKVNNNKIQFKKSNRDIFKNKEEFKDLCLFNDDLWLKLMQLKKGTPVFKIHWMYPWITYVEGSQEDSDVKEDIKATQEAGKKQL